MNTIQELKIEEIQAVSGGMSDFTSAGAMVIGLGIAGGVATGGFGLLVGGAMLIVGHYQK